MANFCPNCGQPITPGMKFCSNCGATIGNKPAPPAQPQTKPRSSSIIRSDMVVLPLALIFPIIGVPYMWIFGNQTMKKKAVITGIACMLWLYISHGGLKKKETQQPQTATAEQSIKDFGATKDFWKNYKAEVEALGAPFAYGKDDRGAIGGLEENDPRVRVIVETGLLSDKVTKITVKANSGDIQKPGIMMMFNVGCKALVSLTSPTLSEEDCAKVLEDVHLTKNAKAGAAEYKTKRGPVSYCLDNQIEFQNGLEFSAEIK